MKLHRFFLSIFLLIGSNLAYASSKADIPSLGEVAGHLMAGTHVVTQIMHLISFIVGAGLLIMGILYFKANRENPKFMPLDKVALYLVCGVVLVALPFFNQLFGETGSTVDLKKHEKQANIIRTQDPDAPLDWDLDDD